MGRKQNIYYFTPAARTNPFVWLNKTVPAAARILSCG